MDKPLRKIIHVDCDCFYAAVETRDNPALKGQPVAVGGAPDQRGVIATCNYEARAFGVHSAQPSAKALQLCPSLIILPPDFAKYRQASQQIRDIFTRYTELVEPLSLDEAYLDVTDCQQHDNSATRIADAIRQTVRQEVRLTVSAGVAPNKFLAKIASDWRKPDGLFTIAPGAVADFIKALPTRRIHGVGPATLKKLLALDYNTCADLQSASRLELQQHFGKFGERLYHLCRGEDERPVEATRRHKSVSVENTFTTDLFTLEEWLAELPALFDDLKKRATKLDTSYGIGSLYAKVRYQDFTQAGVQASGKSPSIKAFAALFRQLWIKRAQPARLLGIGIKLKDENPQAQMDLFPEEKQIALQRLRQQRF